ncbi:hypothetical protein MPTK1_5g02200 [Marchantia polymorpha subsp. ruderalis]|uniref:Uncharacterized protein n=2 Tax=Marchantia polymorpha TaxID=3197 RepID=A0AAF6BE26_MARPO|nr:hypothetical protein MARPO_0147s0013 [Marchantia polymorpha]BBN10260.1 hypothetical protein Mp_5g02200 [Marchantia polymorpha subsp. ruderalis]|eukprot:PTQ29121.1 hypothetical protein MARPO_0147s0013 [Marchantia polymorpha]
MQRDIHRVFSSTAMQRLCHHLLTLLNRNQYTVVAYFRRCTLLLTTGFSPKTRRHFNFSVIVLEDSQHQQQHRTVSVHPPLWHLQIARTSLTIFNCHIECVTA